MMKIIGITVLGLAAMIGSASAMNFDEAYRVRMVGYENGSRANNGCPRHTTPIGRHGCVGETITDRQVLKFNDEHIDHGCVQGATRTIWKAGTDAYGRPVRWKFVQHAECGPGR